MEGMEAVIDVPEIETEIGVEVEGAELPEGQEQPEKVDPYSSKYSREMSAALKAWRDANPEAAKFARQAKDDHSRLFQLHQLEPKGIDGVREKFALLDSVVHGELKGTEAIAALQDEIRSVAEVDEMLAAGNPAALENFSDEMKVGIAKLTPAILDMVRGLDPDAYSKAVLPHFVEALKGSPLVSDFNGLVDVLNEGPPKWLTDSQKQAWSAERLEKIVSYADRMARWFNGQMEKAGSLKAVDAKPNGVADERARFEQEKQTAHWTTNINPGLDKHADSRFQELFRPYAKRLRLDTAAISALKQSFIDGVTNKAKSNKPYMDQIKRYHGQKNPNPSTVLNFAKVEFDKHADTVLKSLVNERYKPFLSGKPKTETQATGARKAPVAPGVEIRAVKPASSEIDFKNTPLNWLHDRKYRLTSGKVVQVRG